MIQSSSSIKPITSITSSSTSSCSGKRIDVTLKLPQLQNLCKRDPKGYKDDYDAQLRRLKSECGILALSPSSHPSQNLIELIQFTAAVSSSSYKGKDSNEVAQLLIGLLIGNDEMINSTEFANYYLDPSQKQKKKKGGNSVEDKMMSLMTSSNSGENKTNLLHKDVRKACVSALILMRNKGAVQPLILLHLFFQIMSTVPDKALKQLLYQHIVNDIKNVNKKGKRDDQLNRSVQIFLHKIIVNVNQTGKNNNDNGYFLEGDHPLNIAARKAVDMVCDLYRKNVWTSNHAVAILSSAVRSPIINVMTRAIRFFLNIEDKMEYDRQKHQDTTFTNSQQVDLHLYSKKTQKRRRRVGKDIKHRVKIQKEREIVEQGMNSELFHLDTKSTSLESSRKLYPAIELINDPQGLAEHLLKKIKSSHSTSCKFETKLLMMNFLTRLVGNHELLLLPLYPLLQRYMGGHQKDVTMILAYAVQACHEYVPPPEIYGILKTIAHNFITERCSGEQMAVGINAVRAICKRVPSVLSVEEEEEEKNQLRNDIHDDDDDEKDISLSNTSSSIKNIKSKNNGKSKKCHNYTMLDVEAFTRDLAAYAKHNDRSVSIAAKGWVNFIREVHPTLLQGKNRGTVGSALHRAGEKPLRYGERRVADGVEGADLLLEYESKKAEYVNNHNPNSQEEEDEWEEDDSDEDEGNGIQEEQMNDEIENNEEEVNQESDNDADDEVESDWISIETEEDQDQDDDSIPPTLVEVTEKEDGTVVIPSSSTTTDKIDLQSMSEDERKKLRQTVSSTRVFTTADFEKMRKLVEREQRSRRDPRFAAKRKRAIAKGRDFEELSDDDDGMSSSDDDEDEGVSTHGAVNPVDIMAMAKRKRMNKAERLEKIIAGREKFQAKARAGGATNTEKNRKKSFVMTKFSYRTRKKMGQKETSKKSGKKTIFKGSHAAKKRRRKM